MKAKILLLITLSSLSVKAETYSQDNFLNQADQEQFQNRETLFLANTGIINQSYAGCLVDMCCNPNTHACHCCSYDPNSGVFQMDDDVFVFSTPNSQFANRRNENSQ